MVIRGVSRAASEVREADGRVGWLRLLRTLRARRRFGRQLRRLAPVPVLSRRNDAIDPAAPAFHVVHWNAPDFLEVNVIRLDTFHPEARVTVLDNGSRPDLLAEAEARLRRFPNVALLAARGDKPRHTTALQWLLDRARADGARTAVFLDQDAMLLRRVDDLVPAPEENALLVGARDAVAIPRDDGPLRAGWLRSAPRLLHPSLLLLDPARVAASLGPRPFADHPLSSVLAREEGWQYEPYHGLSLRAGGRIRFLECRMSESLPPLTFYEQGGRDYACHAWYSSRTDGLPDTALIDGLPVAWVRSRRAAILDWMRSVEPADARVGP